MIRRRLTCHITAALLVVGSLAGCGDVKRQTRMTNLKIVSLGMLTMTDRLGGFPAAIVDGDGRPLLSWRVAILPILDDGGEALYREFHLDEPWDSDHNKALLARMPEVFVTPGAKAAAGLTDVALPAAPGSLFGEATGTVPLPGAGDAQLAIVKPSAISDGSSKTAMLLTVPGRAEPWTKPDNVTAEAAQLFADAARGGHREIMVVTADGAVHSVSTATNPETVGPLFTRAADDTFAWPD